MDKIDEGSCFYAYTDKKAEDKDFRAWLEKEGFELVPQGDYTTAFGNYYINLNTRTYSPAPSDAKLADVIGNQPIRVDDFRAIYYIYQKYEGVELKPYQEITKFPPLDEYLAERAEARRKYAEEKEAYFSNKTYEEWCEDVANAILNDPMNPWPRKQYTKSSLLQDMAAYERELHRYFEMKEMPIGMREAWYWMTY